MSEFNIEVQGGSSVRLPTAGKYCDRDIIVTASGGGGTDTIEQKLINGSYEYENENLIELPTRAFYYDRFLKKCSFPNVIEVGTETFFYCENLTEINVPKATRLFQQCFGRTAITNISLPLVQSIIQDCFNYCQALERVDAYSATILGVYCFNRCNSLKTLILRKESVATLLNINAFNYCFHFHGTVDSTYNPNGLKDGYVYVPRALISSYQTATNWSSLYANHENIFRALEDYTVDGTITGALDESKI